MAKIRTETLKKVLEQHTYDTPTFRYTIRNAEDFHGQFAVIFRKRLKDLETTVPWEAVAISEDGKTFIRI